MANNFGLAVEVIGPARSWRAIRLLDVDDVVGGVFLPKDGQSNPIDMSRPLPRAPDYAVRGSSRTSRWSASWRSKRRAVGVMTDQGPCAASTVVLAAGMWSRELASAVGVSVPLHAAEHFYIVTEPLAEVPRDLPVLRVTDECTYYKEDAGKLLVGAFEPAAKPWGMAGIPEAFCFDSLPEDMDHFEPILRERHAPPADPRHRRHPDLLQRPGELHPRRPLPRWARRPSCASCSSRPASTRSASRARAGPARCWRSGSATAACRSTSPTSTCAGCTRSRATAPTCASARPRRWACSTPCTGPYRQYATARGVRRTPLHDRLVAAGAVMGETAGWERPNWYAPPGVEPEYRYSWGRQNWFEHTAAECRSVRDAVALFDQSSFAKFLVEGSDACAVLNRISVAELDVPAGRIVYTQWCNEQGGIEADLTVTRLAETSYLVVTGAAVQTRDLAWLREHIPAEARCSRGRHHLRPADAGPDGGRARASCWSG